MQIRTILSKVIPDKIYINMVYFKHFRRFPDLKNPKTFNEKIQWLKLHDRKPEYSVMVDKYRVKEYVANIIGDEYIIPTLGVWDRPEDIDFDSLPDQFVLKWNHDSGSVIICKDKAELNIDDVIKKLSKRVKYNGFDYGREWPYKNVKPKIIAEAYMEDLSKGSIDLTDFKFFCFEGQPTYCQVIKNRNSDERIDFYDMEWKHQSFSGLHYPPYPHSQTLTERPASLDQMIRFAAKLSEGKHFTRVDFYDVNGKPYFGEITFFPASGFGKFDPDEWNYKLGDKIRVP